MRFAAPRLPRRISEVKADLNESRPVEPATRHTPMNAKQVLSGIRKKYPKAAIVREVVLSDFGQIAIQNRYRLNLGGRSAAYWAPKIEAGGEPVADTVPEGWLPGTAIFERRIDGLMLATGQVTAIEVKISVADFRRDNDEKRRAWRDHSHRFIYATPPKLLDPLWIPEGCGLWEIDDSSRSKSGAVTVVKRATVNKTATPLPQHVVNAMFYRVSNYERQSER